MFDVVDAVDVTTYHRGFHGDLNETFFVGAVSEKAKLLVQTTHECLARAIAAGSEQVVLSRLCHCKSPVYCLSVMYT